MSPEKALQLTHDLLKEHGVDGWDVAFDNSVYNQGITDPSRMTIFLSKHFLVEDSDKEIRDTILHEVAHVLAGCHEKHGKKWIKIVEQLGGKPMAKSYVNTVPYRYVGTCGSGCSLAYRHRMVKSATYLCMTCNEEISWSETQEWKSHVKKLEYTFSNKGSISRRKK